MPRTQAQNEAAERDGQFCVWSKYHPDNPTLVEASDVHHLARRQPGGDLPQLCIHLSRSVHMAHHAGLGPTTGQFLDLMWALYGYDLRKDFPAFFAGK